MFYQERKPTTIYSRPDVYKLIDANISLGNLYGGTKSMKTVQCSQQALLLEGPQVSLADRHEFIFSLTF